MNELIYIWVINTGIGLTHVVKKEHDVRGLNVSIDKNVKESGGAPGSYRELQNAAWSIAKLLLSTL